MLPRLPLVALLVAVTTACGARVATDEYTTIVETPPVQFGPGEDAGIPTPAPDTAPLDVAIPDTTAVAPAPELVWVARANGSADVISEYWRHMKRLHVDTTGNSYFDMAIEGTSDWNSAATKFPRAVIVKLTSSGALAWSRSVGGSLHAGDDRALYIAHFNDPAYELGAGVPEPNALFAELDVATGARLRSTSVTRGEASTFGTTAMASSNGSVLVGGVYEGAIDFGSGHRTPADRTRGSFLVAYDAARVPRWLRTFAPAAGAPGAIVVDREGRITIAGKCYRLADFGGGALESSTIDSFFVAGFSAEGTHRFSTLRRGARFQHGIGDLSVDPESGDVVVSTPLELFRLAHDGRELWSRLRDHVHYQLDLSQVRGRTFYALTSPKPGNYEGTAPPEMLLERFEDATPVWSVPVGKIGVARAGNNLWLTSDSLYLTGSLKDFFTYGDVKLTAKMPLGDVFVARFKTP